MDAPTRPAARERPGSAERDGAQSIDRATALLVLVSKLSREGASLRELVVHSGLKQPTVHRMLGALVRSGLVEQDPDSRRYHLGYESYVLGTLASTRYGIHRAAAGSVARLAHVSEDTAFLTVRRGPYSVCLHREEGTYPIRAHVLSVGDRHPLGIGAGGIAILAALSDAEVDEVLSTHEPSYRAHYPAVSAALLRELVAQTREQGFAAHRGLIHPGSWGIGVAVRDEHGVPSAALSIGAHESRLGVERQRMLYALMREEADRLEAQLQQAQRPRGAGPGGKRRTPARLPASLHSGR
jgi:DNA-binding IclR family transcriptional regulator